jgi:3,5-epimerase/4-reductase
MKILIFGNGYVANMFADAYGEDAVISSLRVEDYSDLLEEVKAQKPDVVLNCAGKTGRPNVDWCEDHKMETLASNVVAPVLMARVCEELNIFFVHVGSGCVYAGGPETVYTEDDEPNFEGSFYSRTKAWSEAMLKEFPVLQLRLRMPFDSKPGPRNFVTKIVKYEKVISVPNSISVMEDFLKAGMALIEKRATGVFNLTNPGHISHAEILDMYKELVDPSYNYTLFSMEELEKITKAGRSNCVLSSDKLETYGVHMRPVHQAVRESLVEYAKHMV